MLFDLSFRFPIKSAKRRLSWLTKQLLKWYARMCLSRFVSRCLIAPVNKCLVKSATKNLHNSLVRRTRSPVSLCRLMTARRSLLRSVKTWTRPWRSRRPRKCATMSVWTSPRRPVRKCRRKNVPQSPKPRPTESRRKFVYNKNVKFLHNNCLPKMSFSFWSEIRSFTCS